MLHCVYLDLSGTISCLGDVCCLSHLAKLDKRKTEQVIGKIVPRGEKKPKHYFLNHSFLEGQEL